MTLSSGHSAADFRWTIFEELPGTRGESRMMLFEQDECATREVQIATQFSRQYGKTEDTQIGGQQPEQQLEVRDRRPITARQMQCHNQPHSRVDGVRILGESTFEHVDRGVEAARTP